MITILIMLTTIMIVMMLINPHGNANHTNDNTNNQRTYTSRVLAGACARLGGPEGDADAARADHRLRALGLTQVFIIILIIIMIVIDT